MSVVMNRREREHFSVYEWERKESMSVVMNSRGESMSVAVNERREKACLPKWEYV